LEYLTNIGTGYYISQRVLPYIHGNNNKKNN